MRRKKLLFVFVALLVASLAIVGIACGDGEDEATPSEYERVTGEELTSNTTEYDGRWVEVTGEYEEDLLYACIAVICPPCDYSQLEVTEEYRPFLDIPSDRAILLDVGIVGFYPPTENGRLDMPDIEDGQEILLRGEAEALIIRGLCCDCALYRSLQIHAHSITPIP